MICTIYRNIYDTANGNFIKVDMALDRIKEGKSKEMVEKIRSELDEHRRDVMKNNLPSVCFSGKFLKREDGGLKQHSGLITLDFDDVDTDTYIHTLKENKYTYACWISPSGLGVKALFRIASPDKHKEHYRALAEDFPELDQSGSNISRVCFESYDPNIYINPSSEVYSKIVKIDYVGESNAAIEDSKIFLNITKWLSNRGDAFSQGERNIFIFKLASACCRFGISESSCTDMSLNEYSIDSSFTRSELERTVKSAYKANASKQGTAEFDRGKLVEKKTRSEVEIDKDLYDKTIRPRDVIFAEDVKRDAIAIYDNGYERVQGIGVSQLDKHFKSKAGELTALSGIGNYGKSTLWKWYKLFRAIKFGEKFAFFSPEDNPSYEFYHDFVEILLGCDMTPLNRFRLSRDTYQQAYDFVGRHIFFLSPSKEAPTPEYIKERFLELIIKEDIRGCTIDPFNKMRHEYGERSDKYLERVLPDFLKFSQVNDIFFEIILHPSKMKKGSDGNYECPDIYDMADGGMWNNMLDNLLIYHKPFQQTDPSNTLAEFHSKKIRRQKQIGERGFFEFEYSRKHRRFLFDGEDPMASIIQEKIGDTFSIKELKPSENEIAESNDLPF